jgi:hypothetical protein
MAGVGHVKKTKKLLEAARSLFSFSLLFDHVRRKHVRGKDQLSGHPRKVWGGPKGGRIPIEELYNLFLVLI